MLTHTHRYEAAKGALSQLEAEKGMVDVRLSQMVKNIHNVQRELNLKRNQVRKLNETNQELMTTVERLKKMAKNKNLLKLL